MRAAPSPKKMKIVASRQAEADALRPAASPAPKELQANSGPGALPLPSTRPRRFARVPTHVVGVVHDQRAYPRALLRLPLRLKRVAGHEEPVPLTLLTQNISSSGVFFLCPRRIEPGTPIELEVGLVDRPLGRGSVRMSTAAHVVRVEPTDTPGWHGLAASFDDFDFERDEPIPPRFLKA